ncbi:FecCD family ABC transporter permease [Pseudoalteromonas fenneropenaei]|uniref:FecCD family ABC transporter permease n=1 Tax=Pseudoalteromonas fenneropenaei TaxID=1737459 RepID=A0ABV7CQ23_9GAMM
MLLRNKPTTSPRYHPTGQLLFQTSSTSWLIAKRPVFVALSLLLLLLLCTVWSLSVGSTSLSLSEVAQALMGEGSRMKQILVLDLRLPRVTSVIAAGLGMGIAGSLLQNLIRNRLATPDMVGVNEGAIFAMVLVSLLFTQAAIVWWMAPVGALIAMLMLYAFCHKHEHQGYTFIVVGLGFSTFLRSITEFLMSTDSLVHVSSIYVWSMGSFIGQSLTSTYVVLALLALTSPLLAYLVAQLNLLRVGQVQAMSLGVPVLRVQVLTLSLAVLITALSSAIAGPIAFIAMAAPILASSLLRHRTVPIWVAGLCGAILLMLSDTLVRVLANPEEVATGILTRIIGGIFLFWIIIKDSIKGRT